VRGEEEEGALLSEMLVRDPKAWQPAYNAWASAGRGLQNALWGAQI